MDKKKVWYVTGASKGLGLLLVKRLLQEGYKVAATSRKLDALVKEAGQPGDHFLPMEVDLGKESSVQQSIEKTVAAFGRIDVVVNNAGFGQFGTLEELSDKEVRGNFEINVFALLNVVRSVLPHLRSNASGHIFNISSIAGYTGAFPGWGIYCATKFAVNGLSESLAEEVKPFGIHVTIVQPGYFRTNFLSAGSIGLPENPIAVYENARASQALHQHDLDGNQQGDPEKAILALIKVAAEPNPPVHLFLGQDAYDMAYAKMGAVTKDLEAWKQVTVSTGFDKEQVPA
jgi:NAD(P)-dependent dehydrogenase (short-subunit alcohol dehydrogenase family)